MYGSPVEPSSRSVAAHTQLFDCYDVGVLFGGALVVCDETIIVGILMWGEQPYPALDIDTNLGRCATLWGIYILPDYRNKGLGDPLMNKMFDDAKDLGFNTVSTIMQRTNPFLRGETPEEGLMDHFIDKRGARSDEFIIHFCVKGRFSH